MSIGSDLRQAREEHALTLGEISTRTKIRVPVLRAIESDDFDHVPGGVITRGFLKLYAREVGLDPDEMARRFNALHAEALENHARKEGAEPGHVEPRKQSIAALPSFFPAAVVIAGIVVLGGGYMAWSRTGRTATPEAPATAAAATTEKPPAPPPGQPEAPPTKPAADAAAPVPTTGTPADASRAAAGVLRVDVRATEASWLAATADGEQVAYRVLNAGDHVSLSIRTEAVLRIGMPGNLTLSINDAPVKPFGRPGTPVTVRITPANYRDLLAQ
jgi:cytoskeletal protein RodZ